MECYKAFVYQIHGGGGMHANINLSFVKYIEDGGTEQLWRVRAPSSGGCVVCGNAL